MKAPPLLLPLWVRLRAHLTPDQAALLVGAIAIRLRETPERAGQLRSRALFNEWLNASPPNAPIPPHLTTNTAREFRDLILAEAGKVSLGSLDDRVLADLVRFIRDALLANQNRDLAEQLVRNWTLARDDSMVAPLPEIARFMVDATRSAPGGHIVCSEIGSEPVAIACMQSGYVPVCISTTPPYVALVFSLLTDAPLQFRPHAHGFEHLEERRSNDTTRPRVIVPRLRRPEIDVDRKGNASLEFDWSPEESHALRNAAEPESGCTVVLVTTRALFSRGISSQKFRRALVESGRLQSIVSFPASPLTGSLFPFSVLIFNDNREDNPPPITFCRVDEDLHFTFPAGQLRTRDGTFTGGPDILHMLHEPNAPWCRSVTLDEVAQEGYILAVDRYLNAGAHTALKLATRERKMLPLGDIAEVIKAQSLRSSDTLPVVTVQEVSPSEFPQFAYLKNALRERAVNPDDRKRHDKQVIHNGDVLLSTKGIIGRIAISQPNSDRAPIVASPSTVILRLKSDSPICDPVVLLMYLRSPLFQSLLNAVVVGTTIANVSLFDLRKLPVVIPTLDEQERMRKAFDRQVQLQHQIEQLQQQQAAAAHVVWATLGLAETEKST